MEGAAIVTDVSSTKQAIVEAARRLPPRFTFVGGHPMGGAARGGIANGDVAAAKKTASDIQAMLK